MDFYSFGEEEEIPKMKRSLALLSILFLSAPAAFAALGDQAGFQATSQSAATGSKTLHANAAVSTRVSTDERFSVRTEQTDAYTMREYISPSGVVFAVAWNGLTPPEMSHVLGSYLREYRTARDRTARVKGRRNRVIQSDRVIVENWGHMRSLEGRAYDASLFPSGVTLEDIK
jgi:hypothetical protein